MISNQAIFRRLQWYAVLTLAISGFVIGCVPIPVQPTEGEHTLTGRLSVPIKSGEAVAIFAIPSMYQIPGAEECAGEAVAKVYPETQIITPDGLLRSAFTSYSLPITAAARTEYLQSLMNRPPLKERLASMRIRLVFLVQSSTITSIQSSDWGGGYGAGPGYAGVLLWFTGSSLKMSGLKATVLDVETSGLAGEADANSYATSKAGGLVLPIPAGVALLPFVSPETRACEELQTAISEFLSGQQHVEE